MDIQSIKIDLIQWLTELQDKSILEQLQAFKHRQEKVLSEGHKALLDDRIASYEKDPEKVLNWDDLMKEMEREIRVTR